LFNSFIIPCFFCGGLCKYTIHAKYFLALAEHGFWAVRDWVGTLGSGGQKTSANSFDLISISATMNQHPPALPHHEGWMDGKCSGSSFLLGFSSLSKPWWLSSVAFS
jgi:hypothetical protein